MGKVLQFPKRRRRHLRMAIRQPVALVHANGTVATVLAVDVSLGGLQVTCDRYTLDALFPCGSGPNRPVGTLVDAHFRLPLRSGLAKLDMRCRVAYVSETDAERIFLVGLEFRGADQAGRATLETFLEEALALDLA